MRSPTPASRRCSPASRTGGVAPQDLAECLGTELGRHALRDQEVGQPVRARRRRNRPAAGWPPTRHRSGASGAGARRSSGRPSRQKLSCLACSTCGSAQTWARTASGIGPSTSTRAMASPPGRSRPRWKVAMLIPASPRIRPKRADQARLVLVADIEHVRPQLGLDRDAADRDQPRLSVLEQRAAHRPRAALGHHLDGQQGLVVVDGLAGDHRARRCCAAWRSPVR